MEKRILCANRYSVLLHIFATYIDGLSHRKAKTFPLTKGVGRSTLMCADLVSVGIQEISTRVVLAGEPAKEAIVIAVGNKTNILGIPLFCINEVLLLGNGAHLVLCQFAKREADVL